nr:hypothetical protein [Tanacetum cinerariifolium]
MARLAFCDYHNMIAILEKYEHNVNFHPIVDFVKASHIRYALTIHPTVYVSYIRKFWSTARIETTDEGTKILATIDGQFRQITHTRMYAVPFHTRKVFTTLRVNSPSFSGRTIPLFDSMLVHQGKGSGTPTEPHHTPCPEVPQSPQHDLSSSIHPPVTTAKIPTVIPTDIPILRQYSRRARIAQSLALLTAADEPASPLRDDTQDLEIASLKARIKMLEDKDGGVVEPSKEDATIKGKSLETREEAGVDKMVSVHPAAEVATVNVPTGSGMVPTASLIFTIASVVTSYSRRKVKEKMVESDTPKKKKLQEQIDVQVAREIEKQIAREDQRMNEQIARDAENTCRKRAADAD